MTFSGSQAGPHKAVLNILLGKREVRKEWRVLDLLASVDKVTGEGCHVESLKDSFDPLQPQGIMTRNCWQGQQWLNLSHQSKSCMHSVEPSPHPNPNISPQDAWTPHGNGTLHCVQLTFLFTSENHKPPDRQKEDEKEMLYWERIIFLRPAMGTPVSEDLPSLGV